MRPALRLALPLIFAALPLFASEGDHEGHGEHEEHAEAAEHGDHDHEDHADHDDHDEDAKHLSELDGVEILHAWTNAGETKNVRVYMEIANEGDVGIKLTDVHTDIAGGWALKGAPIQAGSSALVDVPELVIAPGSEIDLTPDGLFVYLTDVSSKRIEGEAFEIELVLEPLGEVEVYVAIEDADATQHSHAGHTH